ncbi:MAG: cyclodeaminase/cyclohydrolase family protein [Desulfobacterales bacterium]|nr:MAG: cyclodeaminase/cyclohydrolase family protein [Desulfobacterales bacterium]
MLSGLTIQEFLLKTASHSPVPGGGSVAALSASLAASLTEMVANLTINKKGYEGFEQEMKTIAKEAHQFGKKFAQDIDKDANAYNEVMSAYHLPKDTQEEKKIRQEAIQDGLMQAASIPLDVAKNAAKLMVFAGKAVEQGNKNAITDGAVAAMMAKTAALSALYNVKINLNSITDEIFVEEVSKQIKDLEVDVVNKEKEILSLVDL